MTYFIKFEANLSFFAGRKLLKEFFKYNSSNNFILILEYISNVQTRVYIKS